MTINDRAMIVGQYPTEGAGGSVEPFLMPEGVSAQMTFGRAVDAQGNIHLEGKGVIPTVKVPVTVDTLQQQANGVDVVLAAAEKALDEPRGAGVTPSGPPRLMSTSETQAAVQAGIKQFEELAREQYTNADYLDTNKSFTFTIALDKSQDLLWAWSWCASDTATLQSNLKDMDVKFTLDGQAVTSDQFLQLDYSNQGQQCTADLLGLTDWPGGEHHAVTMLTFKAKLNDGAYDFAPGTQTFDYGVFVKP
jgi:hypothetical protein